MVRDYREERYRQERELDDIVCDKKEELRIWKENGGKLITFKDRLKSLKGSGEAHQNSLREISGSEPQAVVKCGKPVKNIGGSMLDEKQEPGLCWCSKHYVTEEFTHDDYVKLL